MNVLVASANNPRKVLDPLRTTTLDVDAIVPETANIFKRNLSVFRQGQRIIRREDPDLILGNGAMSYPAIPLGLRYDIPVVVRVPGNIWHEGEELAATARRDGDYSRWLAHEGATLAKSLFKYVDGFVAVSTHIEEVIREQTHRSADSVAVVHSPVRFDRYNRGECDSLLADHEVTTETVLTTVTDITFDRKFKGTKRAIESIAELMQRDRSISYLLAYEARKNEPELRAFVDDVAPSADVRERIHLLGYVDDISDLYAASDVFVYVSLFDGYPNVVLEAQAAGLPVVVNEAQGMVDQVDHQETGLFADPDGYDVGECAAQFLSDPDWADTVGENAEKAVREHNAPDRVGRRMAAVLEEFAQQ